MRTKLLSLLVLSVALVAGDLQAQTIYDNQSLDGTNVGFGGGTGFPQARNLLGEDINTMLPPNAGDEWQVDSATINIIVYGDGMATETYTDVAVTVTFIGNVVADPDSGANTAEQFANGTVLGSETVVLGDYDTGEAGGNLAYLNIPVPLTSGINIGDGQDIGVTFEFSDTTTASESGYLAVAFRNAGDANLPAVGESTRVNFRDEDQNGIINGTDNFGFLSDARLRFSLEASIATTTGFVAPDSYDVFRGSELNGAVSDFSESDDVVASYNPGFTIGNFEAPVWLIFDGNAASAADIVVESSAGTPGLEYTAEAFNWANGAYDVVGTQVESFNTDQIVNFPVVAADHIDTDGAVRSRVGWRRIGFTINFPWQVNVDQVGWNQ